MNIPKQLKTQLGSQLLSYQSGLGLEVWVFLNFLAFYIKFEMIWLPRV